MVKPMVKPGIASFLEWYPNTLYLFGVFFVHVEIRVGNDTRWRYSEVRIDEDSTFFDHEFNVHSDFDEFANLCIKQAYNNTNGYVCIGKHENVEIRVEASGAFTDYYFCVHLSQAEDVCGPWNGEDRYLVLMNVGY